MYKVQLTSQSVGNLQEIKSYISESWKISLPSKEGAINTNGLNISAEAMKEITSVDKEGWKKEIADIRANHYPKFKNHLPKELNEQLDILEANLQKM